MLKEGISIEAVARFEKVSYEQFLQDIGGISINDTDASSVTAIEESYVRRAYDKIQLPTRATSGSAGYDFKSPLHLTIKPGMSVKVPTGIRAVISPGWFLACFPRSGLGFKYRLQLDNTVGIIDSDYSGSENEGHIWLKITNDGKFGKVVRINIGDGIAQGIFLPYGVTYSDDVKTVRNGGMGSTGK